MHHDKPVVDSWAIANYLEDNFPDRPSLFGGEGGRAMARMLNAWGDIAIVGGIFPLIIADIPKNLAEVDAAYFRQSREARFGGKSLEEIMASRDTGVVAFRKSLEVMRQTLKKQPFIGGTAPNYADYIVFGGFQWARAVSPFKLLEADDPVYAWREKLLDAFDGMARNRRGIQSELRSPDGAQRNPGIVPQAMTAPDYACAPSGLRAAACLAQTLPAQAILALDRHRQLCRLLGAPAIAREVAAEFGAAAGTGEAARGRLRMRDFFRICHDLRKSFAVIFMSGSSPAAVY